MTTSPLFFTQADHQRLSDLLALARKNRLEDPRHLDGLDHELRLATVVPPHDIPDDVVTLHSRLKLEFPDSKRAVACQLVLPAELNLTAGRVSILSPLGIALIGRRAGDHVHFTVRNLPRSVRILALLYQPESDQRRHPHHRTPILH